MAVTLLRAYAGFAVGAVCVFPDSTESALIAQGIATAATGQPAQTFPAGTTMYQPSTVGGNPRDLSGAGYSTPTNEGGPRILPNGTILAFASLGTNTTLVAGTLYRSEIYVPHANTWTGIGMLNGATVGTNNGLIALYDTAGNFIQSSAVAGAVTAGANSFQNRAFIAPVILQPGRYFLAYQANGTTDTLRTWAAANGGNQMTSSATGTFGTLPTSFTPPTTFTADVGPIAWLYE
jgi:hypothetical protein